MLGAGWPQEPVRLEGDTVTLTFSMSSGREHSTPDRAVWGFRVTVRAVEGEQGQQPLPFISDLTLSLSSLLCANLQSLYTGQPLTRAETVCSHLLESGLLSGCRWQQPRLHSREEGEQLPRLPLSPDCLTTLHGLAGVKLPLLRPSAATVIQPHRYSTPHWRN